MKTGIVWFDAHQAWYCSGGQNTKPLQSIQDLAADTLWLTNLTHTELCKAGMKQLSHIRSHDYLQTPLSELSSELGLETATFPLEYRVQLLSKIVHRLLNAAKTLWNIIPQSTQLTIDVAKTLRIPSSALPDKFYGYFRSIADHPSLISPSLTRAKTQTGSFVVRPNRLCHAQYILNQDSPMDMHWEREYKVRTDRNDQWLENIHTPFLVRCTIRTSHSFLRHFLPHTSQNYRHWLTNIEWRVIRQYGDVTVDAALINQSPSPSLEYKERLSNNDYDSLSLSKGLLAEHICAAHILKQPYQHNKWRWSAAALWFKAIDRMRMFEYAQKLKNQDIDATRYRLGSLVITHPAHEHTHVLETVIKAGLLPPIRMPYAANRPIQVSL